jgi:hypothetical protein
MQWISTSLSLLSSFGVSTRFIFEAYFKMEMDWTELKRIQFPARSKDEYSFQIAFQV